MIVSKEIEGDTYKQLINYAYSKCNYLLVKYYTDQHWKKSTKTLEIILATPGFTKDDIIKNYSDDYLEYAYRYFKDNEKIFDWNYFQVRKRKNLSNDKEHEYFNRKSIIKGTINRFIYNYIKEEWLKKVKHNIVLKRTNFTEDFIVDFLEDFGKDFNNKIPYSEVYVLKFNEEMKKELLNRKSIYDYKFLESLEDISFLKDNSYWLYSITHENICDIYCEDEKEFEYLKSLGIEFEGNKFEKIFNSEKLDFKL